MVVKINLKNLEQNNGLICSTCLENHEFLFLYGGRFSQIDFMEKLKSKKTYSCQAWLFCGNCMIVHQQKNNTFLKDIFNDHENQVNQFTNENLNLKEQISQLNGKIENLKSDLDQRESLLAEYKSLFGNQQCEQLVRKINFIEIYQLFMCMKELSQEVKELYSDQVISNLEQFEDQEATCETISSFFKSSMKNLINCILQDALEVISQDLEASKENETKLKEMHKTFLKQYKEQIEDGLNDAEKFSSSILNQFNQRKIQNKKNTLEKIQLIKEMVIKQFK